MEAICHGPISTNASTTGPSRGQLDAASMGCAMTDSYNRGRDGSLLRSNYAIGQRAKSDLDPTRTFRRFRQSPDSEGRPLETAERAAARARRLRVGQAPCLR